MVTPFRGKNLALESLDLLIERSIRARISGLIVLGTTGEAPTVTFEERKILIARAVATSNKRIPIFVGIGSNDTAHVLRQVDQAEECGADGLLVVTPYYSKPTEEGLRRYFLTIADRTKLPIILYHIPGRCAVGISIPLVLELARHKNIMGIKDAGGDVSRVSEIARLAPEEFTVLAGDDGLTLPMMSVGAVGTVSVLSNLVPEIMVNMVRNASVGNYSEALVSHRKLAPLIHALFLESSPAPIKEALNLTDIKVGAVRAPLVPVSSKTKAVIKKTLQELGLAI